MSVDLRLGDCREVLRTLDEASFDSCVTDPPSGIAFMGKKWDRFPNLLAFQDFIAECFTEAYRVLKPGAHVLAWGLPRTHHHTAMGIERAGFEIRDVVDHLCGQGFPKNHNIAEEMRKKLGVSGRIGNMPVDPLDWDGWGTALKPGAEFWTLGRKPLDGTVIENVARHHTGGINIEGCRVPLVGELAPQGSGNGNPNSVLSQVANSTGNGGNQTPDSGRWPANAIFSHDERCVEVGLHRVLGTNPPGPGPRGVAYSGSQGAPTQIQQYGADDGTEIVPLFACVPDCPVRILDEQSGRRTSGANPTRRGADKFRGAYGDFAGQEACDAARGVSIGGASRFFFTAKPSAAEKNEGLPPGVENDHPTVKSIALMRWLTRLITPPRGKVLDLYMGSGTTGCACALEDFGFFGIDSDAHNVEDLAGPRIAHYSRQPSLFAGAGR